jgi:hypothetical protein
MSNTFQAKSKMNTAKNFNQHASTNLGRLPTLGLGKIRAEDFADDTANPFKVQENTEKLLVMRELEREFKDLNRFEKEGLLIH